MRKTPAKTESPQFDFTEPKKVASVSDLLREINAEYTNNDGAEVTFRSLKRTLELVEEISGVTVETTDELVDIQTLKVIKLLFKKGDKRLKDGGERVNRRNIFSLIQRPKAPPSGAVAASNGRKRAGRATMESCTATTISMDPDGNELIAELVSVLSRGVDPEKRAVLESILAGPDLTGARQAAALSGAEIDLGLASQGELKAMDVAATRSDAEKLLDHIALGTAAVEELFDRWFGGDDRRLASAYRALMTEIGNLDIRSIGRTDVPVHEAMYLHLRTLGLQHFILHHGVYVAEIQVNRILDIEQELSSFCERAKEKSGILFSPQDYVVPLQTLEEFADTYNDELTSLVEVATGLATPRTSRRKNVIRSKKILQWALYRRYERRPPQVAYVCLLDVIAALCSVRYQQDRKTPYPAYWESQPTQGTSPERMLDAFDSASKHGLHQGVFLLYYNRYKDYLATFTGASESHRAFSDFELCRLNGYLAAMRSRSLTEFQAATLGLSNFSLIVALDVVYGNLVSAERT